MTRVVIDNPQFWYNPTAKNAYLHAWHKTKKPYNDIFIELCIAKSAFYSFQYAVGILGKCRFILGEEAISKDPQFACWYSKHMLNTRWPEAEKIISQSKYKKSYEEIHGITL